VSLKLLESDANIRELTSTAAKQEQLQIVAETIEVPVTTSPTPPPPAFLKTQVTPQTMAKKRHTRERVAWDSRMIKSWAGRGGGDTCKRPDSHYVEDELEDLSKTIFVEGEVLKLRNKKSGEESCVGSSGEVSASLTWEGYKIKTFRFDSELGGLGRQLTWQVSRGAEKEEKWENLDEAVTTEGTGSSVLIPNCEGQCKMKATFKPGAGGTRDSPLLCRVAFNCEDCTPTSTKAPPVDFEVCYFGAQALVSSWLSRRSPTSSTVTWVTHVTPQRLQAFKAAAQDWGGHISLAVYSGDPMREMSFIREALDHPRLDIHVVLATPGSIYPSALLQNIALKRARSGTVLLSPAETVLSISSHEKIATALKGINGDTLILTVCHNRATQPNPDL